ncbi:hypothetical protein [Streptomyces sp. NBC_00572]|uniref:hypothetical protein n=1 Tax=Streptomyces sp. NBC_00572 TaxID=2903664 RepID=UPI0022507957|nr:hypothetical protein [Streptomyces sp. NBC_00572]MCX4985963.1 hypothetical protein [Streptomyces sp. NBC_00572]
MLLAHWGYSLDEHRLLVRAQGIKPVISRRGHVGEHRGRHLGHAPDPVDGRGRSGRGR